MCNSAECKTVRGQKVEPITRLARHYERGLMTWREYIEETYRALEDMGGPDIIR